MNLISSFLASRALSVVLIALLSGGVWFIYSELQDKAVIEKELSELKAAQVVIEKADKGLIERQTVVKTQARQVKAEVEHATNKDSGTLTDKSVLTILCANGMAHASICKDTGPLPN